MSENFADLYVQMIRAANEGKLKFSPKRTCENTSPTRFEDFARETARVDEERAHKAA